MLATPPHSNQHSDSFSKSGDSTYIACSEINYPPFEYRDESGKVVGFDIDLLSAIGQKAGFNVRFQNRPWKQWPGTLEDGSCDIWASAISITEERAQTVSYSKPYLSTYSVIFVLDNVQNKNIINFEDLKDKTISSHSNTVNFDKLKELHGGKQEKIVIENSDYLAVKRLWAGTVDAVIGDVNVLSYYFKSRPEIKVPSFKIGENEQINLGFTVKKGRIDLVKQINQGLDAIKQDSTYQKIHAQWFGNS